MTLKLEDEVTDYLRCEAERVTVWNDLDHIENGVTRVPLTIRESDSHRSLLWIGAAASIMVVVGFALRSSSSAQDPRIIVLGSSTPAESVAIATSLPPDTTGAPQTTVPAALARVSLPAGARFQGIAPSCTTVDSIVYECTIPAFPEEASYDMTGYTSVIVDDTSHVSGGCRATSPDATQLTCYVGQRAIEEQIVEAEYFGDWAPGGYTAG